ncbi:MAG: hypothetical protein MR600_07550 [Subdoligranulum sp.]|nr:hypothetical protein [Subdoligranulum sp.]
MPKIAIRPNPRPGQAGAGAAIGCPPKPPQKRDLRIGFYFTPVKNAVLFYAGIHRQALIFTSKNAKIKIMATPHNSRLTA